MLVRPSLTGGCDPVETKSAPDLLPTKLHLLFFLEPLRQMVIVESPVLPPRRLHNPLHRLFLDLALTATASIAMHHALGSLLGYPTLDPVTLPLTDPQYQSCLHYRQLASIHSLYYL